MHETRCARTKTKRPAGYENENDGNNYNENDGNNYNENENYNEEYCKENDGARCPRSANYMRC